MNPRIKWIVISAASILCAGAADAQQPLVNLDTALRCSAAFGIVAAEQQREVAAAQRDYPPLALRGREFFVQTGARLMDEQALDRAQVQQRLQSEVRKLQAEISAAPDPAAQTRAVMLPCLTLLDAALPPRR